MKQLATELRGIIEQFVKELEQIPDKIFQEKSKPTSWSKKEILGHLVDSAENNIRRFIVAQYEENPFIKYNQDKWVSLAGYQHWNNNDIIQLWYSLNKQICYILDNADPAMYQRTCLTGDAHTIEWLAADYIKHLLHHMHVILELEPVPYP